MMFAQKFDWKVNPYLGIPDKVTKDLINVTTTYTTYTKYLFLEDDIVPDI